MTNRSGFSLIEQVVAIASVAVVSAVVVPAVVNQLDKSEVSRIANDLRSLESATKQFRTDVGYWPQQIQHLVRPLDTGDKDVYGQTMLPTVYRAWKGPYMEPKNLGFELANNGPVMPSAGGSYVLNLFYHNAWLQTSGETVRFTTMYVGAVRRGIAAKVSQEIDGETLVEPVTGAAAADHSLGRVRWQPPSSCGGTSGTVCTDQHVGTMIYLAGPIN